MTVTQSAIIATMITIVLVVPPSLSPLLGFGGLTDFKEITIATVYAFTAAITTLIAVAS